MHHLGLELGDQIDLDEPESQGELAEQVCTVLEKWEMHLGRWRNKLRLEELGAKFNRRVNSKEVGKLDWKGIAKSSEAIGNGVGSCQRDWTGVGTN